MGRMAKTPRKGKRQKAKVRAPHRDVLPAWNPGHGPAERAIRAAARSASGLHTQKRSVQARPRLQASVEGDRLPGHIGVVQREPRDEARSLLEPARALEGGVLVVLLDE